MAIIYNYYPINTFKIFVVTIIKKYWEYISKWGHVIIAVLQII